MGSKSAAAGTCCSIPPSTGKEIHSQCEFLINNVGISQIEVDAVVWVIIGNNPVKIQPVLINCNNTDAIGAGKVVVIILNVRCPGSGLRSVLSGKFPGCSVVIAESEDVCRL